MNQVTSKMLEAKRGRISLKNSEKRSSWTRKFNKNLHWFSRYWASQSTRVKKSKRKTFKRCLLLPLVCKGIPKERYKLISSKRKTQSPSRGLQQIDNPCRLILQWSLYFHRKITSLLKLMLSQKLPLLSPRKRKRASLHWVKALLAS